MLAVYVPALVPAGTMKKTRQDSVSPEIELVLNFNEVGVVDTHLDDIEPVTVTLMVNEPVP